jgi:DNA-binding NarL/FixJ family response regulator
MSEEIGVLIVEDHRVLAEGLEIVLSRAPGLRVVGVAATVAQAVLLAGTAAPDVVLMDEHLPDGNGSDAARAIRVIAPNIAVVMLSGDTSEASIFAAVQAGASGYLAKTMSAAPIVDAVRRAHAGEMLLPPEMLVDLLRSERQRSLERAERDKLRASLTPREREVLGLMATGLDNQAIADRLTLSFSTVRGYVQAVIEKLGAHSKLEAVVKANSLGLLDA